MDNRDRIENKFAKITILTEYVFKGRVLEITPSHHLIETSDGKVMEVSNDKVIKVEVRPTETIHNR